MESLKRASLGEPSADIFKIPMVSASFSNFCKDIAILLKQLLLTSRAILG
jgi:hypothetical protein